MKTTACLIALLLIVSLGTAFAEDLPSMGKSEVTIPWDDFKELLEKWSSTTQDPEPEPPIAFALGRGALSGTLTDGRLELTASYPLSILKKGWVSIPLVPTSSPVEDVTLDGQPAPVADNGGWITLIAKGPQTHRLNFRFSVPAAMRPGPGAASLQLPTAAGQVLTLKPGSKLTDVTVDGATMTKGPGGSVMAILTGDHLRVQYTVALEEQQEEVKEKLPPKVLVENSTLVSIDEGFIRAIVQLAYEVRHAPVTAFKVVIPEGFEVADCTGASLVGWKVEKETRELTATVGFEVKGAYSLTVVLERSTKQESFAFPLPAVSGIDVERDRGFFAVQVTGGVEVTVGDEIKGLQMVDAKELPTGLRGGATNPIVLSFKYLQHPFDASLKVVRHKTQPVLSAAIDTANYVVQLTEDGDAVTRAVYTVRNNRKQFLEMKLPDPDNDKLWSSFVADKPVRPSKTKDDTILLPLEKSSFGDGDLQSFNVEVIYYSNVGSSLKPAGSLNLQLPEVDLPISRSMLTVFGPARFAYSRVAGSMRERYSAPVSTGIPFPLGAAKMAEEYKDEAGDMPSAPRKKMKAMDKLSYRADVQQAEAEQVFQQRIRAAQNVQDSTGALPARFSVPEQGRSLRFEELITIQEASNVRLVYGAKSLLSTFSYAALIITALLAWFATKWLSGSNSRGRTWFGLLVAAIVLLVAMGVSVGYVIGGAFLGLGARFVRWVTIQAMRQRNNAGV
jgi:hypothetical protein